MSSSTAPNAAISASHVSVQFGGNCVVDDVTFQARTGRITGLCGPNGSGKSTLLRSLFGAVSVRTGAVWIGSRPLEDFSRREVARRVAVVLQERPSDFDFTVREVVEMGQTSHRRPLFGGSDQADQQISQAIARVGLTGLEDRRFANLSGGEKQRALIAQCMVQDAPVVLLDEPTNHLDVHYQLQLLDLVASLDATVVMAVHDLNLAAAYCDDICLIKNGRIVAQGIADDVLEPATLSDVFEVDVHRGVHPITRRPQFSFSSFQHTQIQRAPSEGTLHEI